MVEQTDVLSPDFIVFGMSSWRPLTSHCQYVPVIGQYIRPKLSNWLVEIPGFAAECIPHQNMKIRPCIQSRS